MDVGVIQYGEKLKKLLQRLLEPNFEVRNDIYLNSLYSHLSGKHDKGLSEKLLNLPILTEWIIQACSIWEAGQRRPSSSASNFVLHLTSFLSKDETKFTYFKTYNVYNTLCQVLDVKSPSTAPTIKLGYIKMLSALLHHKSGLDWLISTDNWRGVFNYALEGQTIYITREGQEFMYSLLRESIDYNEIFCNLIIKQISVRLCDYPCQNGVYPEVREEMLRKRMEPILKLINYMFEKFITDVKVDYRIPLIFIMNYKLEATMWNLCSVAQNIDFVHEVDKTLICSYFLQMLIIKGTTMPRTEIKKLGAGLLKVLSNRITKGLHFNVLKTCHYIYHLWKCVLPHFPEFHTEEAKLRAENSLLPMEVLPMVFVAIKYCSLTMNDCELDDIRDVFITKILKSMGEQTTRVTYLWKHELSELNEVFPLAQQAIRLMMCNRKNYHRSRAIIIFQACIYSFKDITCSLKDHPDRCAPFIQNSSYLVALMNCLATFINEYNITWTESVETICVLSVVIEFINLNVWEPRVIAEALKLLDLSIAKYMSPNLALLVDKTHDSALDHIGPLLINKLHDMSWEVRDGALEVLNTLSTFSYVKFPSFQTVIKSCDLISLALTMAINDSESFVRASALKCMQEMIIVPEFWNPILLQLELPRKVMQILRNEPEAIVRTEASRLMRFIYEHQAFPSEMMEQVYDSMHYAATADLHWEVKTNALDFWSKVILNHLQNQGMIDGKFPDVTFSKEHKKIVTLTENEIRLRLHKVLHHLSDCGCLGVFVNALQEDCDIEVVKTAVEKLKKFSLLLQMYQLNSGNIPEIPASSTKSDSPRSTSGYSTSSTLNTPPITPAMEFSDDIIDQIVNTSDLSLLTNVFNQSDDVPTLSGFVKPGKHISPELFLKVIENDLDAIVAEKTKWLSNIDDLNSLLDDILKTYSPEVNSMDCY